MHGFVIREKYNARIATVHLWDRRPAAKATVVLDLLTHWMSNDAFDPLKPNEGAIWA